MALVSVIWGVALLAIIAVSILWTGNTSAHLARNDFASARIDALAEAAVSRAALAILATRPEARWRVDGAPYDFSFDGAAVRLAIQDELGRIDLNRADGPVIAALLRSAGLDGEAAANLTDKILDWRDASPLKRLNGAKERDYREAGQNYRPRNGPFQSLDELKLVMGMTPELFGRIAPALTIWSGRPFVDPNVAPREVLRALPGMDDNKVAALLAARNGQFSLLPPQGRAFGVSLRIDRPEAAIAREVVIRMTDDPARPLWILSWRLP
jgi:general secretion pathway protein K